MKKIIGIFPTVKLFQNDNPFEDEYKFLNNYSKRVYEAGAIPFGILLNNGKLDYEILDMCDAFLLPGGNRVDHETYKLLEYARIKKKPVLGICLGMQAMAIYSTMIEECLNNNISYDDEKARNELYQQVKKDNPILTILEDDNIHNHFVLRNTIEEGKHEITINDYSYLKDCYEQDKINVVSLHNIIASRIGVLFDVVASSPDGVIEAIEPKDKDLFWIGVQYHPEVDDNDKLIKYFVNNIK